MFFPTEQTMKRRALLTRSTTLTPALAALMLTAFTAGPFAAPETDPVEIVIRSVGNELRFDTTAFTVKAGQEVRLVFENKATVQGLAHNVVILTDAEAIDRVGVAALSAAANDYIPEDEAILFYTPLAQPGETVEVTFTAPSEPGDYPFICSFPGHYVLMRGVMKVT